MIPARLAAAALAATAAFAFLPAAAAEAEFDPTRYVALGDSYSSGTGTGDYFDEVCRRSDKAYPRLLAEGLSAEFAFEACSGATAADLLSQQLGALDAETDIVTVTIGGNDIEWARAARACITPFVNCMDEIEASEALVQNQLPGLLDGAYGAIEDRAPNADVYVLGYPRLFNGESACGALKQPNVGEQVRMNEAADLLAEVLQNKAEEHGFTFVDVRDAFDGHAICDDVAYLNGLAYPTAESYHPTAMGHRDGYYPAVVRALA
ncbi:SGNH/GDSL hydrolase family protein [Glycomyces luteolus]|uniref:SGNH/GDSL hydrolase family protein n=1 Tax=Glycomyces luteolus TaxID=2670330 RepID=A0A9X3PD20_9ACTN|nr:SGNH/GDSL hydrolase family protein [Glycomyces luteolus]MDA1360379.1 SGNH/GDSL hydrolase family protein [Glycomyces luteolus]